MTTSLFAALSGIHAHQNWIDVIGNNLANASTPGYKSSRATFADSFAQTLRYASGPVGNLGGRNPVQIGLGVQTAGIDRNFSQGAITTTGRIFDLAIEGRGFFALQDGSGRAYTRVGTFGLDAAENLVDQRTGMAVLGPNGQPVTIDTHTLFPPKSTEAVEFAGNLPAHVTGPIAEVLTGSRGLKDGSPASLTAADPGPSYAVTPGATYSLEVVVNGGAPQLVTVTDGDSDGFLTSTEITAALDALEEVRAEIDGSGFIVVSTDRTGEAATLRIDPGSPNDLADLINLSTTQVAGSETDVTPTTDLNRLPGNVVDYEVGDEIDVLGVDTDGSPVNGTFVYGVDGTTVQSFVQFLDGLYADAEVSLNAEGQIVVAAQTPQEADLLLTIADDGVATGSTQWSDYAVSVTTEGAGPDTVVTSTEVFDTAGVAHTVTFQYERQADGSWNVLATMPDADGTVVDGLITGLHFGEDGTPSGMGSVDRRVVIQFAGQASAQEIELDFGSDGKLDGLTQFGSEPTAFIERQDGFSEGHLANMSVRTDGTIEGHYTNGQSRTLGAVGIATFSNPEGLHELGQNLWLVTGNSGAPTLGPGAGLATGDVIGGALESSNVDTAEEFVRLIEAQRGFQANARVITTQDEVLAEVVNLI